MVCHITISRYTPLPEKEGLTLTLWANVAKFSTVQTLWEKCFPDYWQIRDSTGLASTFNRFDLWFFSLGIYEGERVWISLSHITRTNEAAYWSSYRYSLQQCIEANSESLDNFIFKTSWFLIIYNVQLRKNCSICSIPGLLSVQ